MSGLVGFFEPFLRLHHKQQPKSCVSSIGGDVGGNGNVSGANDSTSSRYRTSATSDNHINLGISMTIDRQRPHEQRQHASKRRRLEDNDENNYYTKNNNTNNTTSTQHHYDTTSKRRRTTTISSTSRSTSSGSENQIIKTLTKYSNDLSYLLRNLDTLLSSSKSTSSKLRNTMHSRIIDTLQSLKALNCDNHNNNNDDDDDCNYDRSGNESSVSNDAAVATAAGQDFMISLEMIQESNIDKMLRRLLLVDNMNSHEYKQITKEVLKCWKIDERSILGSSNGNNNNHHQEEEGEDPTRNDSFDISLQDLDNRFFHDEHNQIDQNNASSKENDVDTHTYDTQTSSVSLDDIPTTMQAWKNVISAPFTNYIKLRVMGTSDAKSDPTDDSGHASIDHDGNYADDMTIKIRNSYLKDEINMLGNYYYDSQCEDNDQDIIDNEDEDDGNNDSDEENMEGEADNNINNSSRSLQNSNYNENENFLETQPPLAGIHFSHQNTLQEFTPSPTSPTPSQSQPTPNKNSGTHRQRHHQLPSQSSGSTTYMSNYSSERKQKNKNYHINTNSNAVATTLYQSQDTNASFYETQNLHQDDFVRDSSILNNNKNKDSINTASSSTKSKSNIPTITSQSSSKKKRKIKKPVIKNIPQIDIATQEITKINDLDLQTTKTISIPLASVRLIRDTDQLKHLYEQPGINERIKHCIEMVRSQDMTLQYQYETLRRDINRKLQETWEEDGPLYQNFKNRNCLCLEVMELDESYLVSEEDEADKGDANDGDRKRKDRNQIIRQSAAAVFNTQTKETDASATSCPTKKRRIKLFFYSNYARKISDYIQSEMKILDVDEKDLLKSNHSFLISLKNIPSICIFPYHMRREGRVGEALLEHNFGRLATCCICIGGEGKVLDNRARIDGKKGFIPFHSDDLEVRLWKIPTSADGRSNELVLCKGNIHFDHIEFNQNESCTMGAKFDSLLKLYKEKKAKRIQQIENQINAEANMSTTNTAVAATATNQAPTSTSTLTNPRNKYRICNHDYVTLDQVENIFQRTKGRNSKASEFNCYCIVLSFTVPKLTRKGEWMMTINVFDETITSEDGSVISSMTLTLFHRNRDSLPKILCAGEIIRCHRIVSNKWHDSLQLSTVKWSTHTTMSRYRDENNNVSWKVEGCKKTPLIMPRVMELWKYGHELMKKQSTIDERFRMVIENVETSSGNNDNTPDKTYGDMIVMVANVIPFPILQQTTTSPRGFIRAWDGTGPSTTDPLPFGVQAVPNTEPSSEALSSISQILNEFNSDQNDSTAIQPPKSLCGRVLNIVIWERNHWLLIEKARDHFSVGKFVRLRNVRKGKMYVPTPNERGPICLNVDASTILTPIPDLSYDVIKLLKTHDTKAKSGYPLNPRSGILPLQHKISPKILSEENSLKALPFILQQRNNNVGQGNQWYDLEQCIANDYDTTISYPVRFQIVDILFVSTREESNCVDKHIILDVRDVTAQIAIIIPFDKVLEYSNTLLTNDRVLNSVMNSHQAFYTRIQCVEKDGTNFFVMVDKLRVCAETQPTFDLV